MARYPDGPQEEIYEDLGNYESESGIGSTPLERFQFWREQALVANRAKVTRQQFGIRFLYSALIPAATPWPPPMAEPVPWFEAPVQKPLQPYAPDKIVGGTTPLPIGALQPRDTMPTTFASPFSYTIPDPLPPILEWRPPREEIAHEALNTRVLGGYLAATAGVILALVSLIVTGAYLIGWLK